MKKRRNKKKYMLINIMKKNYSLQHLTAYSVLLILELQVEKIIQTDLSIESLLHRGTKFLIEYKTCIQSMPYFNHLEIVQEHTFCLCVEYLYLNELYFVKI